MRLYFLAETMIWVIIITITVGIIRYCHAQKQKEFKTYRIYMEDIDGLIEGSPVRMLGTSIGYIKTVKIVQGSVYVKFVITDKTVSLPKGVIATVEFNGMAGSKSLELYPPDELSKAEGNMISIKKTNRLSNALGLLDNMFSKFMSIIVRCQVFADSMGVFEQDVKRTKYHKDSILKFDKLLDKSVVNMEDFKSKKDNFKQKMDYTKKLSKPITLNVVEEVPNSEEE